MKSENAQLSKIELETWKEMKELTRVYFRSKVSLLIYSQGKTSPSIRLLGVTVWVIFVDFEWSFEMSDFRRKYDNISAGRIVFWVSRTDFSTVILIFFPLSTTSWGQGSPDNFIGLIQWIKMLLLRKSSHDGWIMSIRPELYRGTTVEYHRRRYYVTRMQVTCLNSFHFEIRILCKKVWNLAVEFRLIYEKLLKSYLSFCEFQKEYFFRWFNFSNI